MKRGYRALGLSLALGVTMMAAGCQKFYRVTDPVSGNVYHTRKVFRRLGGQVSFKDAKSGSRVNLPSSEVKQITEGEYQSGLSTH